MLTKATAIFERVVERRRLTHVTMTGLLQTSRHYWIRRYTVYGKKNCPLDFGVNINRLMSGTMLSNDQALRNIGNNFLILPPSETNL